MQTNLTLKPENKAVPTVVLLVGLTIAILVTIADLVGLSAPGFSSNQLAMATGGIAFFLAGMALVTTGEQRKIAEWLLIAIAAFAITYAADMIISWRLPGLTAKLIMLFSVVGSAILLGANDHEDGLSGLLKIDTQQIAKFLGIGLQVGLLVLLIQQFQLENQAFYASVMLVIAFGFVVHYFLPMAYRLPFFILLSLATFIGILGLANGIWLIGIGLGLIGICHLPISVKARVVVLLVVGTLLTLFRVEILPNPIPLVIWSILGSIFMFRLAIYMYDVSTSKKPIDPKHSLAYFFLLPNIVFPFFPVVDFGTFRRTYYKGDERHQIYQTGVEWMFRGVLQLIIYRAMNYYLVLAPQNVETTAQLVQFALTNFLLYLRVSGQFHIIIGLLHLFGFNLPLTNNNYLLSSSFTDLWRRINIYWKEFMQKLVFYPVFFRLSKQSNAVKLAVATAVVFVVTWALHIYQWFWLRGTFFLLSQDILFWSLLAMLVISNTLYEAKKGRQRTLGKQDFGLRQVLPVAVQNAATISILAFLWSLWTSPGIGYWLELWSIALNPTGILTLIGAFLLMVVVSTVVRLVTREGAKTGLAAMKKPPIFQAMAKNGVLLGAVLLLGTPTVYGYLGEQATVFMDDLRVYRLNSVDSEQLQRGYYEDLQSVNRFNSELNDLYSKRPTDWPIIQDTALATITDDFYFMALNPDTRITFHGEVFTTNSYGMRDKEYAITAPADTFRAALVGPSFVMGSGVADDQIFEAIVEERLNREGGNGGFGNYELLNFGVSGHSALQELYVLETRALDFQPNAIIFVAHQLEERIIVRNLAERIQAGVALPYPYLQELADQTTITADMPLEEAAKQLQPFGKDLVAWTYNQVGMLAKENNMVAIWAFMPTLESDVVAEEKVWLFEMAENAGMSTIDLSPAYENHPINELIVGEWDKHPNALGHKLIADLLYKDLVEQKLIP